MEHIPIDESKINIYAKIQDSLCELLPNSSDESIDEIINQIPQNYLTQKEDLMMICQLFAYYSRNFTQNIKGNAIKLIERILKYMKIYGRFKIGHFTVPFTTFNFMRTYRIFSLNNTKLNVVKGPVKCPFLCLPNIFTSNYLVVNIWWSFLYQIMVI